MQIKIFCNNCSVVQVIRSGKTKDLFWGLCIKNVLLLTAHNDIELEVKNIPGTKNTIANVLSRIYSLKSVNSKVLLDLLDNYQWDVISHSYFDLSLHI